MKHLATCKSFHSKKKKKKKKKKTSSRTSNTKTKTKSRKGLARRDEEISGGKECFTLILFQTHRVLLKDSLIIGIARKNKTRKC